MSHRISSSLTIRAVPSEPVPYKLDGRKQILDCDGSLDENLSQSIGDRDCLVLARDFVDLAKDRDKSLVAAWAKLQACGQSWCDAQIGSHGVTVAKCDSPSQMCVNMASSQHIVVTFDKTKAVKLNVSTVCSPRLYHEMSFSRRFGSDELTCSWESLTKCDSNLVALPDLGNGRVTG